MKLFFITTALMMLSLSGCAPIQDTYKPLYQTTPDKEAIEAKK